MVALRGTNSSISSVSHSCVNHGNSQQTAIDVAQSLQTTLNMPQSAQHMNASQVNLQTLNNVSVQFVSQHTNPSPLKREQASTRYSSSNCMLPSHSHHYRVPSQARPVDIYHPAGTSGATYMPSAAGGGQTSGQGALRVQQTPQQPSAPPAPQQDMSKTTMAGHNFGAPQNQTPQGRPQYNYQYRSAQHGTRPTTHPRQQQPFIPSASAAASGTVMYGTCVQPIVFQPTHMGMQTFQQPRSSNPGFYHQYSMAPYLSYSNPPSHTGPYYYTSNSQTLPTNLQANAPGGRNNPSTSLVGPQGTPPTQSAPSSTLAHPQAPTHMHQALPGNRPLMPKRRHRLPIINPETQQDIFLEINTNENIYTSGYSSGRQTPQSDHPPMPSAAEEFSRRVNEVINQPSPIENSKKIDVPVSTVATSLPQTSNNAISINNNIIKPEILHVNENINLGPDIAVEANETPVVSAISDSPVIVPKMPNNKQLQKNSDQPLVLDTNKNQPNKQHKQNNKSKPVVPEDLERIPDSVSIGASQNAPITVTTAIPAATAVTPATLPPSSSVFSPVTSCLPHYMMTAPQPQRVREHRTRLKSEEKEKTMDREPHTNVEIPPFTPKTNGPTSTHVISSVDSLHEVINSPTSQNSETLGSESTKKHIVTKLTSPPEEDTSLIETKVEQVKGEVTTPDTVGLTATELLSASIEKLAREQPPPPDIPDQKEASSAIEAQAKLTQSIASCIRTNQPESKMKDINLNNKPNTDPDTANGNSTEVTKTETVKEDINKNEKVVKNTKNNNKKSKMTTNDVNVTELESYENGKDETDKISNVELENQESLPKAEETVAKPPTTEASEAVVTPPVFVPKYKYSEDQWSPLNKSGKKCYDIGLLKQIRDDPLSKNKPNVPLLETCNIIRSALIHEHPTIPFISRPMNDSLFPPFAKSPGMGQRSSTSRDTKKDGRNISMGGKGSIKLTPSQSGNSQKMVHVTLSLRDEVKLNEVDSAWRPSRFRKETLAEDDCKTQELYKKFRGILNKLTPQKFDTLLDKIKNLEINNQKRLEGVIDLVFEKAIEEPNFSEAYAAMCNKLSKLQVPADNATSPDQTVNFRGLIISKCQTQFVAGKEDEQVMKLQKDIAECTDPAKKKEIQIMLEEENRRVRMRSVGNVRFIGELYKLKMLTPKIMAYCMKHLIDNLEEEKLECLCKLLTTIGEQVENEARDQLDSVFKKMQDIIADRKNNKISSRVRFMIQDVIELRRRKWVIKSVVDSQPKMMDQIQKEAEQQQRHIELMNSAPMNFRREEGGRGKRGDSRRQNSNSFQMESNMWKSSSSRYTVDTSKLKTVTSKNLSSIKLAPTVCWNHGSTLKTAQQPQQASSNSLIGVKNMYSVLENAQTDPTSIRGSKDIASSYHSKGASIERSTFNSRADFNSSSRSGSAGVARSNSGSRSTSAAPPTPPAAVETPSPPALPVIQEPLPDDKKQSVKAMIDLCLINPDDDELVSEIKTLFLPQYHAGVVTEIFNMAWEKSAIQLGMIAKSLLHVVSTMTITPENFLLSLTETLDIAPDLYIDIPMLYDYLAKFIAPQIEKKHITLVQVHAISQTIISYKHGNLLLKAILRDLRDSMGPTFVKSKWQESGLQLNQWMNDDQVASWLVDNKFEFLEGGAQVIEETKKILTPAETQKKLLQLLNSDENCDCIKGWVQDNLGKSSDEDWFMRSLIQAICEHALFGSEGRDMAPHFNQERMTKYIGLINEFGETKQTREASCLFGIQQLIHRLEHPQGLTLEIFAYLHEQYIISVEGFIAWELSELEPEGKGVIMKALTSFFTNIKEADNEDSCSED